MEEAKLYIALVSLAVSISAIFISRQTANKLKSNDIEIDRRKLFITVLWEKLIEVRALNPGNATSDLVLRIVSTLYLAALCWRSGVVDKTLLAFTFGQNYLDRIREIDTITKNSGHQNYDNVIVDLGIEGPVLLNQSSIIREVGDEIKEFIKRAPKLF